MATRLRALLFSPTFFLLLGALLLTVPLPAHAQLVQCSGLACEFCDLFKLADNIIHYLILAGISIAAIMFSYAGFLYFTSGGSEERASKAKTIFKDVFFGFVFALLGFVLVDTLLRSLSNGQLTAPSWTSVQCFRGARNVMGTGLTFYGSPSEFVSGIEDPNNPSDPAARYDPVIGTGGCGVSEMGSVFGSNAAANMSCICGKESGGVARVSTTDRSWVDGNAFSTGLLQVNMVTTPAFTCNPYGQGNVTLNCSAAFRADPSQLNQCRKFQNTNTNICGSAGWAYGVVNQTLYNSCVNALNTPQCNAAAVLPLFQTQGYSAWQISARACGAL